MPLEKKSLPPASTITLCAAAPRVAVGLEQPPALGGAHRAVVEVELQVADAGLLGVLDLAPGVTVGDRGVDRHVDLGDVEPDAGQLERTGGGQLEAGPGA